MLALTMWRENRGGGEAGMQSVGNVIVNRALRSRISVYAVCTAAEQFSSITAKGDPELDLWPNESDTQWAMALDLAARAAAGALPDITGGADLYYAPRGIVSHRTFTLPNGTSIPFPATWNENAVVYTCTIAGQVFFR